jgi:hypothetical protein
MSLDTPSITWRHSRAGARAWTMSFGIKQSWLNSCMMFMLRMKKAMISRLGLSIVRVETSTSKKCDIYATPADYKWRFDPLVSKKINKFSKIYRHFGTFSELNSIIKGISDASTRFLPALTGTNIQFLAVLVHLARTRKW